MTGAQRQTDVLVRCACRLRAAGRAATGRRAPCSRGRRRGRLWWPSGRNAAGCTSFVSPRCSDGWGMGLCRRRCRACRRRSRARRWKCSTCIHNRPPAIVPTNAADFRPFFIWSPPIGVRVLQTLFGGDLGGAVRSTRASRPLKCGFQRPRSVLLMSSSGHVVTVLCRRRWPAAVRPSDRGSVLLLSE
jgi:hypothetical protein